MSEKLNSFESQRKSFDAAASKAVVSRVVVLRNLNKLEAIGTERAGTGGLSADVFAESMHTAYDRVLELNENGNVQPPLTAKQQEELIARRALYNVFLPKDRGEEKVPATPTAVDQIDTSKQKA